MLEPEGCQSDFEKKVAKIEDFFLILFFAICTQIFCALQSYFIILGSIKCCTSGGWLNLLLQNLVVQGVPLENYKNIIM